MKKIICLFTFFFRVCAFGQLPGDNALAKNTFYFELASKGAVYSVNFDHIFRIGTNVNYSYRIGFSIQKNSVSFPVGISMITGKESHHAEVGLTVIPFIDKYKTFLSGSNESDKYLYVVPSFGYRFQPAVGGLFLKVSIAPLILLDPPSDNFWKIDPKLFGYGNVGIGYSL